MKRIIFDILFWSLCIVVGILAFGFLFPVLLENRYPFSNPHADPNLFWGSVFGFISAVVLVAMAVVYLTQIKSRPRHAFHKKVQALEDAVFSDHTGKVLQVGEKPPVEKALTELEEWVTETYPKWKKNKEISKTLWL